MQILTPLGDLSWGYSDRWLIVGNPEDIVYMYIEENPEVQDFYNRILRFPIKDELRIAQKIRQINFCLEPDTAKKDFLKPMVNNLNWSSGAYPGPDHVVDDPAVALAELEALLTEMRAHYPIKQNGDDSQGADQYGKTTKWDRWRDVFEDIEDLRRLLPSLNAPTHSSSKPPSLAFRLGHWARKLVRSQKRGSGEASFSETVKVVNRLAGCDHESSDSEGILSRLRRHVGIALSESSEADAEIWYSFHQCFIEACRERYRLVHGLNWSEEADLELMKRYLVQPVHTPWVTNYVLATVFDRRILGTRSDLRTLRHQVRINLAVFLSLAVAVSSLFAFGLAWLAWPVVAFLIWRFSQEWQLFRVITAAEIRGAVLQAARTEIVSGCYDAEEISRRLQMKALTLSFPTLVSPLLKLGSVRRA
jgi:hypothetical protein